MAAWLLREQGHEVIGLFMDHGQAMDLPHAPRCAAQESLPHTPQCAAQEYPSEGKLQVGPCEARGVDARRVADALGIPFYELNLQKQFERIIDSFVEEYVSGRTPNPCVVCNARLKFGLLLDYAERLGAHYLATGHYARITSEPDGFALRRGVDQAKDQSYMLFGIVRERLGRILLPLGEYRKEHIRRWAGELGLALAEKPESQEICFVPDQDHARLVRHWRPDIQTSGPIVTTDGQVVGQHAGIEHFTIGQRKGLRVGLGERRFVVRIDPETHTVVIGRYEELARWELTAKQANWLIQAPDRPFEAEVKIRYRTPAVPATIEPLGPDRFRVRFSQPCYGVAPGQAAVCYQADRVLGGAWIE